MKRIKLSIIDFRKKKSKEIVHCRYCGTNLFVRIFTNGVDKFGICFNCFQRALDRILDYHEPTPSHELDDMEYPE